MSNVKKKLLEEIDKKVERVRQIRQRTSDSNIDMWVLDFINNIEDNCTLTSDQRTWEAMALVALHSLHERIKTIDAGCMLDVSWHLEENKPPRVNGVIIKWSKLYQVANSCDAELFVDATSALFK